MIKKWSFVVLFLCVTMMSFALNHATKQTGARNRIWPLGIKGDANMSVAVCDTGIDPTHQGFYNGFTANGDWSSKIIYWYAGQESGSLVPLDDSELGAGHGTHAAGIIGSSGFGKVETYYDDVLGKNVNRLINTNAYTSGLNRQYAEQTAFHVNAKGLIEIKYAYDSERGSGDAVILKFGNYEQASQDSGATFKYVVGDNTVVATLSAPVGTPNLRSSSLALSSIVWNTLTYRVENESQFGTYHVITERSGIASGGSIPALMAFEYVAKYPVNVTVTNNIAMDPLDGLPYYMGQAPDVKLFGVQAAGATAFIDSINALWSDLTTYHVGVLNLSAASSSFSSQESMFNSLENMGITVCSAGGNEGAGASISYPSKFANVVTVEGVGPAETIPWYPNTGYEVDILAPGGSNLTGGGIISVHNNQGNFGSTSAAWGTDVIGNDGLGMQGSSMATPSASGVFALVYHALGGWNNYLNNNSFSLNGSTLSKQDKARHAKRLVYMTATELNTKTEINNIAQDPTGRDPILNRGYDPAGDAAAQYYGKDNREGYGRVNVDAAVEAILYDLPFNTNLSFSLVSSRAVWSSTTLNAYNIYTGSYTLSKAEARKAFARHINVTQADITGGKYAGAGSVFTLTVPSTADFDLFVYKPTWGPASEPLLLARSINAQYGGTETVTFNPTVAGQYYVVVKAVAGEGETLLTFGTAGVNAAFTYTKSDLTVNFSDSSTTANGSITSWAWNFGDNSTATTKNPVHTYAAAGTYTVTLVATDSNNKSGTKSQSVTVTGPTQSQYDLSPVSATVASTGVTVYVENLGAVSGVAPMTVTLSKQSTSGSSTDIINTDLETANPFTFSSDNMWEYGVISGLPTTAHSGTKVIATNLDGKYNNNGDTSATLAVNLTGTGTKTLEFWHYYDFNGGYASDTGEDVGFMEISGDNGTTWSRITPQGGYPGTANNNPVLANGTGCYTVKLSGWEKVTVDLSAYNTTVKLRFRVVSDASWTYRGWYIDDVKIVRTTTQSWQQVFSQTPTVTVGPGLTAATVINYTLTDGYYKVEATVNGTNDSNTANNAYTHEVQLGTSANQSPVASFTYTANALAVTFTDTSTDADGTIVSRSWNFGDSSTATTQNPVHTYVAAGTYTVTLTVTDNGGATNTYSASVTVTASTQNTYTNTTVYNIPDYNTTGISSPVTVTRTGDAGSVLVTVDISHTYVGDLSLYLIAPDGTSYTLRERSGGSADDIKESYTVNATGKSSAGEWKLNVKDLARIVTGKLNSWTLKFN